MKNVLQVSASLLIAFALGLSEATADQNAEQPAKIPVIYDSDIGDDIDDTWALCMLLKCPELDVKLVIGDQGKAEYRAKLFAKFLEVAERTDIPIGIGMDVGEHGTGWQQSWVADYELRSYPGTIYNDGVLAIIDTIMDSTEQVTVIAVGPMPNIKEALRREPRIAEKARFVGMYGHVLLGSKGKKRTDWYKEIRAEHNVKINVSASKATFSAPWDITITPIDTCAMVSLKGNKFAAVRDSEDPLAKALIENYYIWARDCTWFKEKYRRVVKQQSTTLFDTVAVYLAFSDALCEMETLPIRVTDEGKTVIDDSAKEIRVATAWKDLGKFEDLLVGRLTKKSE